ncbi:MAG: hypothetical protein FJ144_00125 [Deltaproteobacteria bacterium]|nr:hypothetical protein [Deltaproteobacteria bacterium]
MRTGVQTIAIAAAVTAFFGLAVSTAGAAEMDARRCAVIKLRALVKEVKDKAQCWERSLKAEAPVESDCLSKAEARRDRMFERAEEGAACATQKDGSAYSGRIDAFIGEVSRALLPGAAATASPQSSASPSASPTAAASPAATKPQGEAAPAAEASPAAKK